MDGDDFAFPERFSRQVKFLEEHAAVDLVGCGTINFEGEGRIIGKLRVACEHEDICRCPWRGFPLHHPTWMGKTDWFKKNRYDPRLGRAQDFELLLRTLRSSRFSCVFDPMLGYCLERLTLARQFRSRLNVSRTLLRYGLTERDIRFFWGFAEQWLKMALDAAAIGSGLRYRLLRHRALEVSELEKATFQAAWAKLQKMQQGIPCAA